MHQISQIVVPHLSKWPSDLKINGKHESVTFSGQVFHGLSCGVFLFAVSVQKPPSEWLEFFNSQSGTSILWFLKLTLAAKRKTPHERP